MTKAIFTRFSSATNSRGSRIIAKAEGGSRIVAGYEHALHHGDRHGYAAFQLAKRYGWHGFFKSGDGPKNQTVWVCVSQDGRWPQAAGMADHARLAHDKPYGFERSDWFYLPDPRAGEHGAGKFPTLETEWPVE